MGHHSKRNKFTANSPPPYPNPLGQFFNGLDINSMSNMLNSIDINKLVSLLSNPNSKPTGAASEVNTAEASSNTSTPKPPSPQSEASIQPNIADLLKDFQREAMPKEGNYAPELPPDDPVVIVLNGIKPLLPLDKVEIVDSFIKLLGIKKVIDSIFPPQQNATATASTKKEGPIEKSIDEEPQKT